MIRKLKWSLLAISLLLLSGVGYYTYAFLNFANNIQSKPGSGLKPLGALSTQNLSKNVETYVPPKWEGNQRVNVLLLGGDSRGIKQNETSRSDSLIVASIDPISKKAHLFSIMRDTYVKIPGHGEDRINVAYALGGANLTMNTVSDLLGIPIQYYVYTDFKGFIALVDSIDGIEMDVEKDMKYADTEDGREYDINLKKGLQHLDGKMALQYVRFRHDALSDFSRTERQRNFVQAVVKKLQTTSSLLKIPRILSSIDPYIQTNLSTTDMIKLGSLGYEAKTEGMVSQQIPPSELLLEKKVGGADVISVNRDKLQLFIKSILAGQDLKLSITKAVNSTSGGVEANQRAGALPGSAPASVTRPAIPANKLPVSDSVSDPAASKPASSSNSSSKPISEVPSTSVNKPVSGITPDSANKPASGSSSGSSGKPAIGATSDSLSKPVSDSIPVSKPATTVTSDSLSKPASEPTSEPVNKPATGTMTESVSKPPLKPSTIDKSAVPVPANKPAAGVTSDSLSKPASDSTSVPVNKPATGTMTESVSKPPLKPSTTDKPVVPVPPNKPASSATSAPASTTAN